MDITDTPDLGLLSSLDTTKKAKKVTFPSSPAHNTTVHSLLKSLSQDNLRSNLETFTSFYTRYFRSSYGAESSAWLFGRVNETITNATKSSSLPSPDTPFVRTFPHKWGQSSIIATIPGTSNKTVVIGAHQDSINLFLPSVLPAPGADDDGSGTVTILEAFRVLLSAPELMNGSAPNTLEFHWYSAEEGGLLGSQAIFSAYEKNGRDVKAMLQQDMTGYSKGTLDAGKPEAVGVITDFVDPGLTDFIKKVVGTYCEVGYVETKCGYACSDHASASKAGYPSAFVIESEFGDSDKKIHTTEDKISELDFGHMLQHARLTAGFAYELAFAKFE